VVSLRGDVIPPAGPGSVWAVGFGVRAS